MEHYFYPIVCCIMCTASCLGGVVVSVLATGPNGRRFKPGQSDAFLVAIKINGTSSFGWEVKSEAPYSKILQHVKEPCVA
jgi:hypothetical protein